MNHPIGKFLLTVIWILPFVLLAQIDPNLISSLSKLSVEEKAHLFKQNSGQQNNLNQVSTSDEDLVGFEEFSKPEDKKHTDYFPDLIELEKIISAEIFRLKEELKDELIDEISREATERALKDNEGLLVSLKKLQRDQIQRKIKIIESSVKASDLKPFGHDLFIGLKRKPLMIDAPVPSEYRIGPGDLVEIQLFGQQSILQS